MAKIKRDKLTNVNLANTCKCAFQSINNIHQYSREEQLAGVMYVCISLIKQSGIRLTDLLAIVNNLSYEAENKKRVEFVAVDDYLKRKILKQGD